MILTRRACGYQRQPRAYLKLCVLTALAGCSAIILDAAEQQGREQDSAVSGIDLAGNRHNITSGSDSATVVVFLSTQCPISNGYLPMLKAFRTEYARRRVGLFGVISDAAVTRAEAEQHRKKFEIAFPVLFDASGELRRRLGPTHTPHAFLLDAQGRTVYGGAIDDEYADLGSKKITTTTHYLKNAVDSLLGERPIELHRTTPVGCLLEEAPDERAASDVTYARDIAPIVQANCVACHRPGQSAPFSLLTYDDVSRHARQIAAVTASRFMPPWKPEPDFGHFRDERRLNTRQIELFAKWAESGKARGDDDDLPPPPEFPGGWQLGEPDIVLEMNEIFDVPASGPDIHQLFVLPTGLREHRLVAAVEFQPGEPRVVHHASFYVDITGNARRRDEADKETGYRKFGSPGFAPCSTLRSWLPGMTPRRLPEGNGRLLPRGSDLVVEVHYHPSGKTERDRFKVGLHLAPKEATHIAAELQILNKRLKIPAGARRHHHRSSYTLPVDTLLLDTAPHMHLLGREMKAIAELPDGKVVPLVWIKDWDFNWQGQYIYVEPVRLPKDTRITVDTWYDNSKHNPLNPNSPPETVYWGEESNDEMDICHFQATCETLAELRTLIDHHVAWTARQNEQFLRGLSQRSSNR